MAEAKRKRRQALRLPLYNDDDLRELAVRVVRREVYLPMTEEEVRLGFGLLLALMADQYTAPSMKEIGGVAGEMNKTFNRAINGVPMFTGMLVFSKADYETLLAKVVALEEKLARI